MFKDSSVTYDIKLLILGNGFDLHLGLKTAFSDFLKEEILDEKGGFNESETNLLLYLLYLRFYYPSNYTKTFFRTVYIGDPNWMDVEGFIKIIATDDAIIDGVLKAMSYRSENIGFMGNMDLFVFLIGKFLSKIQLPEKKYDRTTIVNLLGDNLTDFENRFKQFVSKSITNREEYSKKQEDFIRHILDSVPGVSKFPNLRVFSFNYTKNVLNLYKELNLHGSIDDKVVIGYDSTQASVSPNDAFVLSKEWRKNDIEFEYDINENYINSIIVYGHSLGEQDYPYFFDILDRSHILDGGTPIRICFCYSLWEDSEECRKSIEQYRMNATKMLNAYERYKKPNISRNMIITELKARKSLSFVEIKYS